MKMIRFITYRQTKCESLLLTKMDQNFESNFEQVSFNPFSQKKSAFKDIYDPDLIFFFF